MPRASENNLPKLVVPAGSSTQGNRWTGPKRLKVWHEFRMALREPDFYPTLLLCMVFENLPLAKNVLTRFRGRKTAKPSEAGPTADDDARTRRRWLAAEMILMLLACMLSQSFFGFFRMSLGLYMFNVMLNTRAWRVLTALHVLPDRQTVEAYLTWCAQ